MGVKKEQISFLISGPTASGKSSLAHLWAQQNGACIISADSRQSYRFLDIGTAKPDKQMLSEVPYYNISILNPDESDNPMSFLNRVNQWKDEIQSPIVFVGGSTLYQQAILFGFDEIPQSDAGIRLELEQEAKDRGLQFLFEELMKSDPVYAQKMNGLNRQRIIRALEVFRLTGKPFSTFHKIEGQKQKIPVFGLVTERTLLKERINKRVDQMVNDGLLFEIKKILDRGYSFESPGLQTIGYQEWKDFFDGKSNLEEIILVIKTKTWQYAKRQLTWYKRWPFMIPIETSLNSEQKMLQIIDQHIQSK